MLSFNYENCGTVIRRKLTLRAVMTSKLSSAVNTAFNTYVSDTTAAIPTDTERYVFLDKEEN